MASIHGTEECWAPEWVWLTGRFLIYFASGTPANPGGGVQTKSIWAVWTPSFATLSNASVFHPFPLLQPGYSVIDANLVRVPGARIDMFLKDESYARSPDFGKAVKGVSAAKVGGRSPLPASRTHSRRRERGGLSWSTSRRMASASASTCCTTTPTSAPASACRRFAIAW